MATEIFEFFLQEKLEKLLDFQTIGIKTFHSLETSKFPRIRGAFNGSKNRLYLISSFSSILALQTILFRRNGYTFTGKTRENFHLQYILPSIFTRYKHLFSIPFSRTLAYFSVILQIIIIFTFFLWILSYPV